MSQMKGDSVKNIVMGTFAATTIFLGGGRTLGNDTTTAEENSNTLKEVFTLMHSINTTTLLTNQELVHLKESVERIEGKADKNAETIQQIQIGANSGKQNGSAK